jgi:SpoVK/Ycf46/Vps4 family AAA+-type ATPase
MPIELLEKVRVYRSYLVRGDVNKIAKETRRTRQMVYYVLCGDYVSKDIIESVREVAMTNAREMGIELN